MFQGNIIRGPSSNGNINSDPIMSSIKVETIQDETPGAIVYNQNKELKSSSTQTEEHSKPISNNSSTATKTDGNKELKTETVWNINNNEEGKSIADQVKEVAQSAVQQSGMVYVESAGMYYDYKTGYYYNSVSILIFYQND